MGQKTEAPMWFRVVLLEYMENKYVGFLLWLW